MQHIFTKKRTIFTSLAILLLWLYYGNYNGIRIFYQKNPNVKYILYYTKMWNVADFYLGSGNIFENCPIKNCITTSNKNLLPIDEFDALIFHGVEFHPEYNYKPDKRSNDQIYIYASQESPIYSHSKGPVKNFYNWTMTYRQDSDIYRPYGRFIKTSAPSAYNPPTLVEVRKRPKKVAWMVSDCNVSSKRMEIFKKLNQYIDIDVYGKCGSLQCAKSNKEDCLSMLEKNYKFYLSFENSICRDYVTEKMFMILKKNLIPIVYGGSDYDRITPSHSVIDVTKFKSIKKLANFLHSLDDDPVEYLRYFEWKRNYILDSTYTRMLCNLCEKLNQPREHKVYEDVENWWIGNETSPQCLIQDDLPPILFT